MRCLTANDTARGDGKRLGSLGAWSRFRRRLAERQRRFDGFFRCRSLPHDAADSGEDRLGRWRGEHRAPAAEQDDGSAQAQGQRDFRQGAGAAADGDRGICGSDDDDVARLAHAGADGMVYPGIGGRGIVTGQDADRRAAGLLRAATSSRHRPIQPAADQDRAVAREEKADALRCLDFLWRRLAGTAERDSGRGARHVRSVVASG